MRSPDSGEGFSARIGCRSTWLLLLLPQRLLRIDSRSTSRGNGSGEQRGGDESERYGGKLADTHGETSALDGLCQSCTNALYGEETQDSSDDHTGHTHAGRVTQNHLHDIKATCSQGHAYADL